MQNFVFFLLSVGLLIIKPVTKANTNTKGNNTHKCYFRSLR